MFAVALKVLAGRKVGALLTAIAIVLGVAMISGTYILTDTITNGFDTIVVNSYKNGNGVETPTFPQSVLAKVKALPDVAAAAAAVQSENAKLIGKDGKVVDTGGAPSLGFSVDPRDQEFNPTKLTAGSWPTGGDQAVIDKATASREGFVVGDRIQLQAVGPQRSFVISGIAELTGVGSIGGATFALFDLPTAQEVFAKPGQLDVIRIESKAGVSNSQLVSEIRPVLPSTAVVRPANEQVKEDKKEFDLAFLQYILLAFGGISLFVGAFVIANTLSITIAQRMREFATLRTLGASRRQVLWSVVVEAFVIGLLGSLIGLFLGLGLAKLLNKLFVTFGIDLPQGQTVFATRTVIVSLVVGTVVTLVASIRPARRARRRGRARRVRDARQRHRHRAPPADDRRRRAPALLRRLDERRAGRAPARRSPRCACAVDRRRARDPGARQRNEEPGSYGLDGLRADDRARTRHVRGDLQRRDVQVVRERGRPALHRGLRHHGDEHVHADRRRGRQGARRGAGRERRDADPRRVEPLPRRRAQPHRRRAEPGHRRAAGLGLR